MANTRETFSGNLRNRITSVEGSGRGGVGLCGEINNGGFSVDELFVEVICLDGKTK